MKLQVPWTALGVGRWHPLHRNYGPGKVGTFQNADSSSKQAACSLKEILEILRLRKGSREQASLGSDGGASPCLQHVSVINQVLAMISVQNDPKVQILGMLCTGSGPSLQVTIMTSG